MTRCDELRSLIVGDRGLERPEVLEHLAGCQACRDFVRTLDAWRDDARAVSTALVPSDGLEARIGSSPCQRWLSLLFRAVDREISQPELERLLQHLEQCDGCRDAWSDLTLMHQVGEALQPSPETVNRCLAIPHRPARRWVLGRRTVAAAAYVVAVTASLAIGNPVVIARTPSGEAVKRVASDVTNEVAEAARDGRGELRVMLWRLWQAAERGATSIRGAVESLLESESESDDTTQGESHAS